MKELSDVSLKTHDGTRDVSKEKLMEMLENIFITAIEGGSNYWALFPKSDEFKRHPQWSYSETLLRHVVDGGSIDIYDCVDESLLGQVNIDSILLGLEEAAMHHLWALDAELWDEFDAESSDTLFQLFTMREVVYG